MKAFRNRLPQIHGPLVASMILIAALGCYNLHSATAAHGPHLYLTQLSWFCLGLGLMTAIFWVDYRITYSGAYLGYALVCLLLGVVLWTGKSAMGARRWLWVGPWSFQPSEIAKLATIFCMARYFSHRMEPGGYSIGGLVKPLNPSRPLACLGILALYWNKPWLADPLGTLARGIHAKLGNVQPVLENLLWFRALLLGLLILACGASLGWIVRAERASAWLAPWPVGRAKRWMVGTVGVFGGLAAVLLWGWEASWLADPLGVLIRFLNHEARLQGRYAVLQPGLGLRLFLLGLAIVYITASLLAWWRGPHRGVDVLIAPLDLLMVPVLMILVEPDLGSAGIVMLIGMTLMGVVGIQLRSLMMMGFLGAVVSAVAWFGILKDYQKRRILTFIDPEQDIQGAGWNAVQSLIAVGSGRWFGKGHLGGTQTQLSFLPEQHTDFAFSVWAEEQGFVGCAVVLILYWALLMFALGIAAEARDTYGVLLATGVAAWVVWQTLINIGMVVGVLPVVGIPLPLFSYGGSSLLTMMVGIGLLLNIYGRRRMR